MIRRVGMPIVAWLARRLGMELHYPPAREPSSEPRSTLADDGRPCSPWPAESERVWRPKLGDPR